MKVCTIEGCERPFRARGWCATHYARWSKHGDPSVKITRRTEVGCEAPDCERPNPVGRYCNTHKLRKWKTGTFDAHESTGRRIHDQGYVIVKQPDHPLAWRGWVYEHRAVLFAEIGPGWHPCHRCGMQVSWELSYPQNLDALVVDHLDEDKANNAVSNLAPSCSVCNFARSSRWKKREAVAK